MLPWSDLSVKSHESKNNNWDEYYVDHNVGVISMESAILDIKVLEGKAWIRELKHILLWLDDLDGFFSLLVGGRADLSAPLLWFIIGRHSYMFKKRFIIIDVSEISTY